MIFRFVANWAAPMVWMALTLPPLDSMNPLRLARVPPGRHHIVQDDIGRPRDNLALEFRLGEKPVQSAFFRMGNIVDLNDARVNLPPRLVRDDFGHKRRYRVIQPPLAHPAQGQ